MKWYNLNLKILQALQLFPDIKLRVGLSIKATLTFFIPCVAPSSLIESPLTPATSRYSFYRAPFKIQHTFSSPVAQERVLHTNLKDKSCLAWQQVEEIKNKSLQLVERQGGRVERKEARGVFVLSSVVDLKYNHRYKLLAGLKGARAVCKLAYFHYFPP